MKEVNGFLGKNFKVIGALIILIGIILLLTFIKRSTQEPVPQSTEKDLLQTVNEFSETIEDKEDPEVILSGTEDFSEEMTEEENSGVLLQATENFSENNKNNN